MMKNVILTVIRSFGTYKVGAVIEDSATVMSILNSEHANAVVKVSAPTANGSSGKERI
jgi:hypothetical protein